MGISKVTFYVCKKKHAKLGVTELRKLKQLEEENIRLKRLVADCGRGDASRSAWIAVRCPRR
jgi:putative transposase